tara:strand:- start:125 stop:385 length:261 start_codon:yes stop_codon:yes gene_type:complete
MADFGHKGDLYIDTTCELNIIDTEGKLKLDRFIGGKYYWINEVIHYKDGYSDIIFHNGCKLPQIKISEIGYFVGKPDITTVDEVVE